MLMNKQALLEKALQTLKNNTAITSERLSAATSSISAQTPHDPRITLRKGDATQTYLACIKRQISLSQLALLINKDQQSSNELRDTSAHYEHEKMLFVADYINPNMAQFLKQNHCDFIDSVGNAYLSFGPIFVYITGNKAPKVKTQANTTRAFQTAGLKLVFNLLCHPDNILNKNYRELSAISDVSLGSIGVVIKELEAAGYLSLSANNQRKWLDKDGLMERWVVTYAEKLRPKLLLGYYTSLQNNWQAAVDIQSFRALWSGEVAADRLTRYLKPAFSTVYIEESLGKLVLMNGLKEVAEKDRANVEVLQKFWHFETTNKKDLAPALLVYADLIASGDSRNLEVAKMIREEFLNAGE
ncbi:hypothetical protein EOL70_15030 [Leucothrix sargassi]|nr:hypothetical protein EOL70_15030 [Leucothrix sargassi]